MPVATQPGQLGNLHSAVEPKSIQSLKACVMTYLQSLVLVTCSYPTEATLQVRYLWIGVDI